MPKRKSTSEFMLEHFKAKLKFRVETFGDDFESHEALCKYIRLYTPTIPDIDLERYLCPECGKYLGRVRNKEFPDRCPKCRQIIDWGFLS